MWPMVLASGSPNEALGGLQAEYLRSAGSERARSRSIGTDSYFNMEDNTTGCISPSSLFLLFSEKSPFLDQFLLLCSLESSLNSVLTLFFRIVLRCLNQEIEGNKLRT